MHRCRSRLVVVVALCLWLHGLAHAAAMGMTVLSPPAIGPVTVFYPSSGAAARVQRGPFMIEMAVDGAPVQGNGRLVVVSHGSGGSPWESTDLARTLVDAGFVVAVPRHHRDHWEDRSEAGPASWKRRPLEVSAAIDAVAHDPRWSRGSAALKLDRVGLYGMSAGGHTALAMAGGRWSPAQLRHHCAGHLEEDFQGCVGLATRLTGGLLDGVKLRVVRWMQSRRLADKAWYSGDDPRIAAIVAGVPFASDFDPLSLARPRVPLALVTAQRDRWLLPRFHSGPILAACRTCEHLADLADGGHGALLSPLPTVEHALLAELLADPPGFDRAHDVPEVNARIAAFFARHLVHGSRAPAIDTSRRH